MDYIKRIVDKELADTLQVTGAILIRGCKWCGKTTTAKNYAKSILEVQNSDNMDNVINIANAKPSILLEGDKPRLIDECIIKSYMFFYYIGKCIFFKFLRMFI